jgi:hypothetical protein
MKWLVLVLALMVTPLYGSTDWYNYDNHNIKAGLCIDKGEKEEVSINKDQLREAVVIPVLQELGLHSDSAVNLLMGTAAVESNLGEYIVQVKGPARGIFQMEPATHDDIVRHYLHYKPDLVAKIKEASGVNRLDSKHLAGNMYYAAAMARIHYLRNPKPIPPADNIAALGKYWKDVYNTHLGAGTVDKFVEKYERYLA